METAWCSTCKQYLPIAEFHKDAGRKSGLSARCKKCVHERDLSAYGKYKSYRRSAKQRNIDFCISFEQFKGFSKQPCAYCGENANPLNGIDRKDNSIGYVENNLIPCCEWCNRIKLTYTENQMREHIKKMYNHLFEK